METIAHLGSGWTTVKKTQQHHVVVRSDRETGQNGMEINTLHFSKITN